MLSGLYLRLQLNWFVMAITDLLSWGCYFWCLALIRPALLRSLCFPGEMQDSFPLPLQQCSQETQGTIEQQPCSIPDVDRVKAPVPIGAL